MPRSVEAEDGLADIAIAKKDFTLLAQVADSIIGMAPQYAPAYVYRGIAAPAAKSMTKPRLTSSRPSNSIPSLRTPISNSHNSKLA